MELSQISLNNALAFLSYASGIVIVVVGVFLIKFLFDLSALAKNLNKISIILNTQLAPTLKDLSEVIASVNAIVRSTDQGVDNGKAVLEKTFGKTKNLVSGIMQGFSSIFSMFKR